MITWTEHITFDGEKALYKGIDIGISRELIQDMFANNPLLPNDEEIEKIYKSNISAIRDIKLNEILS